MKNNSFLKEMASIVEQADSEQVAEARARLRRARFEKIRKVVLPLLFVGLLGTAYGYRAELGQKWHDLSATYLGDAKEDKKFDAASKAGDSVQLLQQAATKRDTVLDDLAKGK